MQREWPYWWGLFDWGARAPAAIMRSFDDDDVIESSFYVYGSGVYSYVVVPQ